MLYAEYCSCAHIAKNYDATVLQTSRTGVRQCFSVRHHCITRNLFIIKNLAAFILHVRNILCFFAPTRAAFAYTIYIKSFVIN